MIIRVAIALAVCASLAAGCTSDTTTATLRVYAASSLKSTFTDLGKRFEAEHDGIKVEFDFAGSADLAEQIRQGAPADVFASADEKNMDKLVEDGLVAGKAKPFASNVLQIAVPPANPAHVTGLKDLASPEVDVVVCAPQVPCGAAATKVADTARLRFHAVSEEQSVTDVLNKVTSGQAEAGLVYVTDVRAAGDKVKGITFPESANAVNVYPISTVKTSQHVSAARAFADFVLSPTGQEVLHDAGFAKP